MHFSTNDKKTSEKTNSYLSEKVGTFTMKRSAGAYDEILEIEVTKETLLETESAIRANAARFSNSLKIDQADFKKERKPKGQNLSFKGFK